MPSCSRSHPLVVVVVVTLALACVPAAGAAFNGGSPCSLTTKAEVKAAFGGTVGTGKVDNSIPGAPTCHFSIKSSNLGMSGSAVVFETPSQTPATFALAKKIVPGAVSSAASRNVAPGTPVGGGRTCGRFAAVCL
jgi:hypothetical protein